MKREFNPTQNAQGHDWFYLRRHQTHHPYPRKKNKKVGRKYRRRGESWTTGVNPNNARQENLIRVTPKTDVDFPYTQGKDVTSPQTLESREA